MTTWTGYDAAVARLRADLAALPDGAPVRLGKRTSNLFRSRDTVAARLDVSAFAGVLEVDPISHSAGAGHDDVRAAGGRHLPHGLMPLVVPQLKTITLGGAVTGARDRGVQLPQRHPARVGGRDGRPDRRRPGGDLQPGGGRRPVLRLPELLRDARLRAAAADRARAGAALRPPPARPGRLGCGGGRPDGRGLCGGDVRGGGGGLRRRDVVRAAGGLRDARQLGGRGAAAVRLHRHGHLLPVDPGQDRGLAHGARLPVALGHRLVLVLAGVRRPGPADSALGPEALPAQRRLVEAGGVRAQAPLEGPPGTAGAACRSARR